MVLQISGTLLFLMSSKRRENSNGKSWYKSLKNGELVLEILGQIAISQHLPSRGSIAYCNYIKSCSTYIITNL